MYYFLYTWFLKKLKMVKLLSLIKIVVGILGTFLIIQVILGLPLIFIFKININSNKVTKDLILLNSITEIILVTFYFYQFKLFNKFLLNFKEINFKKLFIGFFLSVAIPIFLYFILYIYNNGVFVRNSTNLIEQIGYMFSILILATCEELICRFILLEKFCTKTSKFISILISSLFFMGLHLANPGLTFISILNLFLFGTLLSLIYFKTKDVLLISLIHFGWNYTNGCIIGSNVSGVEFPSIFKYLGGQSTFLDGGKFGIEGSPLTLIGLAISILIFSIFTNKINDKLKIINVE